MSMARTTPAQNPRGFASTTFLIAMRCSFDKKSAGRRSAGKRQKAKGKRWKREPLGWHSTARFLLLPFASCLLPFALRRRRRLTQSHQRIAEKNPTLNDRFVVRHGFGAHDGFADGQGLTFGASAVEE